MIPASSGFPFSLTWAPDLKHFVVYWNRRQPERGLWLLSDEGRDERLLAKGGRVVPLGWSADGKWLRVAPKLDGIEFPKDLVEVPLTGEPERPWFKVPIPSRLEECSLALDSKQLVCTAGGDADVWMIDGFDRLLQDR